jgi:hypothetical protein
MGPGGLQRFCQHWAQALTDGSHRLPADLHLQQLIEQRLVLLKLNGKALPDRPTRTLRLGGP